MQNTVKSKILRTQQISDSLRKEMFELFAQYYLDVDFSQFEKDFAEKTHVFLFTDAKGLVGFSTIYRKAFPEIANGLFLFSGDTVLRKDRWGGKFLQMTFFKFIVESKLKSPFKPVYWMLISKGVKTYLMMRRNFAESYPQARVKTPESMRRVMDQFYTLKYGNRYDPIDHLIRFDTAQGAVKGSIAAPSEHLLKDIDVQFFLKANPTYQEATELACISEIRFQDFLSHIPKYFLKGSKTA